MTFQRTQARAADALRPITLTRHYTKHAEGSVLVEFGHTKVLCTASVEEKVPPHKRGTFSSTDAVHSTLVWPNSTSTEPSACFV